MMFWDMISLGGYLTLNAVIALVTLRAERESAAPPRWIKPVIILSREEPLFSPAPPRVEVLT